MGVALPSGLGLRGSGAGNQWTWRNFVQGVNQQDSDGKLIPSGPPGTPSFEAYQFVSAFGPYIGPVNPTIGPLFILTYGFPGMFLIACSGLAANYDIQCTVDFTFSGGLSDGILSVSTNTAGLNDLYYATGGTSTMHAVFTATIPPATMNMIFDIGTVSIQPIQFVTVTVVVIP